MSESKKEYPYIGKVGGANQVVLFVGKEEGIVIESHFALNKIGDRIDSWLEAMFCDITEEYLADKKIKILSPLHSEYVQKLAFKYGYGWEEGIDKSVQFTDRKYLYLYKHGNDICHDNDDWTFIDDKFQEITIPLPEDYVSSDDEGVLENEDNMEEGNTLCVKVGDNIVAKHVNGLTLEGELLALTKEYTIIQQVGHEQHLGLRTWKLSKAKTEEELLWESLLDTLNDFESQFNESCDIDYKEFPEYLMERYSITKKPR